MGNGFNRKTQRFYVINPRTDRRLELRFYSRENVVVKAFDSHGEKAFPAVATEIGKRGMRIKLDHLLRPGSSIQIAFPNSPDYIRCFGNIIWSHPPALGSGFECGVIVTAWHGITRGTESYRKFQGTRTKNDRRMRPR